MSSRVIVAMSLFIKVVVRGDMWLTAIRRLSTRARLGGKIPFLSCMN